MSIPYGAIDLSALAAPRPSPASGPTAVVPDGASWVFEVSDANFPQLVMELSNRVPVVIDFWAAWHEPCNELSPLLEQVVNSFAGRMVLATVDVDANPQLVQAFRVQSPASVNVVWQGQVVPGFQGALPQEQIRRVLDQLLAVTGATMTVPPLGIEPTGEQVSEPTPPPSDPRLEAAFDAVESGDWEVARQAYQSVLNDIPADAMAKAGLAQVGLLERLDKLPGIPEQVLAVAERLEPDSPAYLQANLDAADVLVADGRGEEAFARLIAVIKTLVNPEREHVRTRMLELFEVFGPDDPAVVASRRRLANALY